MNSTADKRTQRERLDAILAEAGRIAANKNDLVALRILDTIAAYDEKDYDCNERTLLCYVLKLRQDGLGELASKVAIQPLMELMVLLTVLGR